MMDDIEQKMGEETYEAAKDLKLEANKSIKLESSTQLGYFFRITLKVRSEHLFHILIKWLSV